MSDRATKRLKNAIEKEQEVKWWGKPTKITPRLCSEVFGDGQILLALAPMMFRPNHFIVRIDSTWFVRDNDDELREHLDEIYDSIEDEYYEWPWASEYGLKSPDDDEDDYEGTARTSFNDGSAWWKEDWPKGTKPKTIAQPPEPPR